MKTLDEVIEELEDFLIEDEGMFADALHYLKEYQRVRSQPNSCCIDDYDKPMWNPKEHWE